MGVVGVLAGALVIGGTAAQGWLDARRVLDAHVSYGLLLVLAACATLVGAALFRGVSLLRDPAGRAARRSEALVAPITGWNGPRRTRRAHR